TIRSRSCIVLFHVNWAASSPCLQAGGGSSAPLRAIQLPFLSACGRSARCAEAPWRGGRGNRSHPPRAQHPGGGWRERRGGARDRCAVSPPWAGSQAASGGLGRSASLPTVRRWKATGGAVEAPAPSFQLGGT